MVTERLSRDASQQGPSPADGGLDFEIVDSTSAGQRQQERELLADAGADAGQPVEQARPQPEDQAPPEPQPETEKAPGETQPKPEQRGGRTYSQEEVSKMQAAWARQVQQARRNAEQADRQLKQFNLDASVEAAMRQQEQQLSSRMTPEQAREAVRSPQNAQLVRRALVSQHALLVAEAGRRHAADQQEKQAKYIVAQTLMRQHGVPEEDFATLSSAPTPSAMVQLARRLGGNSGEAMLSRVPPETPETELENGYYAGPAPENESRRLGRIRSKPSWEWTDADLRFMRTGEVR